MTYWLLLFCYCGQYQSKEGTVEISSSQIVLIVGEGVCVCGGGGGGGRWEGWSWWGMRFNSTEENDKNSSSFIYL